jgi:hypothetical protein
MDDQTANRDGGGGMEPQQIFSSDNDVLPENEGPIPLTRINRWFMGVFALKLGCIFVFFLLILFVGLIAKFSGDGRHKPPADAVDGNFNPTSRP